MSMSLSPSNKSLAPLAGVAAARVQKSSLHVAMPERRGWHVVWHKDKVT